jgi:hypothetical protein
MLLCAQLRWQNADHHHHNQAEPAFHRKASPCRQTPALFSDASRRTAQNRLYRGTVEAQQSQSQSGTAHIGFQGWYLQKLSDNVHGHSHREKSE